MAEPEMGRGKHSAPYFSFNRSIGSYRRKGQFKAEGTENTPGEFAKSNPRLGQAAHVLD
jgi:hypothetical protein